MDQGEVRLKIPVIKWEDVELLNRILQWHVVAAFHKPCSKVLNSLYLVNVGHQLRRMSSHRIFEV